MAGSFWKSMRRLVGGEDGLGLEHGGPIERGSAFAAARSAWARSGGIVVLVSFLPLAAVSIWLSWSVSVEEIRLARERFSFKIDEAQAAIHQRLVAYEQVLRGGLGLFIAKTNKVSREEWRSYVRTLALDRNFPGIQGVGYSVRVPASERDAHVQSIRAEGFPTYDILPKGERSEYTAIIYLEPFDWRNQRAFGYDMFSEPVRRDAMVRARDAGVASVSGKVILVQETDQGVQNGFLMYLPVYRSAETPRTLAGRRDELMGYVYAPFRMGDLMRGILGAEQLSNIRIEIFDGSGANPSNLLYDSLAKTGDETRSTFVTEEPLPIDGQHWTVRFSSLPAFEATIEKQKPRLILTGGLAGSGLFAAVAWSLWLNRRRANALMYANRRLEAEIAQRTVLETQLKTAKEIAESANRAKSAFLANMSHELRTPLNAILGYAQLLKRHKGLTEWQLGASNTIQQSGEHLLTLVSDILDLSKIEAGKLELSPGPVALHEFLRGITDIVGIRADEKNLAFVHHIAADLPSYVQVDEKCLRQVLLNLLGNAVKFTDRGRVELAVAPVSRAANEVLVRFEVCDTGIGIAPNQLAIIFQPFEQACEPKRRAGGTGLGLNISRELVHLMGSEIRLASTPGEGSCFSFELALPLVEAQPIVAVAPEDLAGYLGPRRKILIVDDIAENRAVLADMLGAIGIEVHAATSGLEGIEQASRLRPDLIMMDIMMEGMDGLEAIRRIRAMPDIGSIPIIAVSASVGIEDQRRNLSVGADAFLAKPIDQRQLYHGIGRLLHLAWIDEPPPLSSAADQTAVQSYVLPAEEAKTLLALARGGNIRRIREHLRHLASLDEQYRPLSERLQQLARTYDTKAILKLAEDIVDQEKAATS